MAPSKDEIDGRIRETRGYVDENPRAEDELGESDVARYAKIAAVVVGAAAVAVAGVLIYRRMNRPARREQLRAMLVDALEDLPEMLRDLPDEIVRKIRQPLPSIKFDVPEAGTRVRGAVDRMIRRARD
jgi:hypothetical protein